MKITFATKITIARIALIVPTVILYIAGIVYQADATIYMALMITACLLYGTLCCTDFIDGAIARKTNTVSDLGKFLDPLADKVIIVVMLFLIVYHGNSVDGIFPYNSLVIAILGGVILSREVMISVFRGMAVQKGIVLAADIFGKIKTVLLDFGVGILIIAGLHPVVAWIGTILFYLGAIMTVVSGANYLIKNKKVFVDDVKTEETKSAEEKAE
ncbi:MAG: CDP-diacylglycerol--glycerol-3-phosphate 3-phosphatidyltransferase [Clostridia bacterium]|nr:CDP-diacylglycerol--glycerol-3-phosphate 3-phosphatidyltransferase [Clostridia bacterium]